MALIVVPKTPKKAFDKYRRPSALLLGQIQHLEWAVLPASRRKPRQLPKKKVKTEGQAAERIAQLTKLVMAARTATADRSLAAAATLPPIPRAEARPSRARKKPARKTASKARKKPARKTASKARTRPARKAASKARKKPARKAASKARTRPVKRARRRRSRG